MRRTWSTLVALLLAFAMIAAACGDDDDSSSSGDADTAAAAEANQRAEQAESALADAEQQAASHGARSMTLHVFARNARARRLYEAAQYDGELLRYLKRLG